MLSRMKSEGMLKGAPDLILINQPPGSPGPVAIEMKRLKGGALSADQVQVIAQMRNAGWIVIVALGAQQAITALEGLGF